MCVEYGVGDIIDSNLVLRVSMDLLAPVHLLSSVSLIIEYSPKSWNPIILNLKFSPKGPRFF